MNKFRIYNLLASLFSPPSPLEKPFDFIMSVGPACRPAEALRRNGLRYTSSPFDWMMAYKIECISDFFKNGFENFFKDYVDMNKNEHGKRMVMDKKTGMIAMHSFPDNEEIYQYYPTFFHTMNSRFEKIKSIINNSKRVAFLSYRKGERDSIVYFLKEMDNIFPQKEFVYINMLDVHNRNMEKIKISKNLYMYEFSFKDDAPEGHPYAWLGNAEEWDNILKKIKIIPPASITEGDSEIDSL